MRDLMPERLNLGQYMNTTLSHAINRWEHQINPSGRPTVMGYPLPSWQRPLVWTEDQQINFIKSAWLGLPLGTYSYNETFDEGEFDGLLIDGQQRLYSLERYLRDELPVFGHYYSEVSDREKRSFEMTTVFGCYITNSNNEKFLRGYYNLLNFSGTPHTEDQRA